MLTDGQVQTPAQDNTVAGTEQKPEEVKQPETTGEQPKPESEKPTPEPIEYTDFVLPDGFEYDQAIAADFKSVAKELGLKQDQAQKLVDFYAKQYQAQVQAFQKQIQDWAEQAKKDPVIGGADFDKNIGVAVKALDKFGTPELRQVLDNTGLGNHPEVIKFFYNVGKAISEDGFIEGSRKDAPKSAAEILYPSMIKK